MTLHYLTLLRCLQIHFSQLPSSLYHCISTQFLIQPPRTAARDGPSSWRATANAALHERRSSSGASSFRLQ
eukprot:c6502_g1_i1 orf=361-573(+)